MYIAWSGLRTWHHQLHGQSRFDMARRLALAIRLFREELVYFRNIVDTGGEIRAAQDHYGLPSLAPGEGETNAHRMALKSWKLERLTAKWNDVATISLEAELLLGDHIGKLILECRRTVNEVADAVTEQSLTLEYGSDGLDPQRAREVLYGRSTDNFGAEADQRIDALLRALKPYLQSTAKRRQLSRSKGDRLVREAE